jgi:protein tyrosine phosphatase (PTP) superfamily phosphohydrolase (DUF442 family)
MFHNTPTLALDHLPQGCILGMKVSICRRPQREEECSLGKNTPAGASARRTSVLCLWHPVRAARAQRAEQQKMVEHV